MIDVARCYPRHAYSVNSHVYVKCLKNLRTLKLISTGEGSSNNYAYLVVDDKSKDAVIVDPANPPEYIVATLRTFEKLLMYISGLRLS